MQQADRAVRADDSVVEVERPRVRQRPARVAEAAVSVVGLVAVGLLVLSRSTDLAFVLFPLLMWFALRYGQRGAAFASLIVAGIAVDFTSRGIGPFAGGSPRTASRCCPATASTFATRRAT